MILNKKQEQSLLTIAEWSIQSYLDTGKVMDLPDSIPIDDNLKTRAGAFVTLYVSGKLRGCIGTFSENKALFEVVKKMAVESATIDNRFEPIKNEELPYLSVEISVLTPRRRIQDVNEIEIGRHGIYLINGYRKGTLLPQVALEHGWDAIHFLEVCAHNKMGLDKDAWRLCEIYVYEKPLSFVKIC